MPLPAYDILKKWDSTLIWVEAAENVECAKKRIEELAKQNHCEYVVFDQRTQEIVASLNPSTV